MDCDGNFTRYISFSGSSDTTQCVTLSIRGDDLVEDTEMFVVVFSSDDERDYIQENSTTVTILDDDGMMQLSQERVIHEINNNPGSKGLFQTSVQINIR